MNTTEATGTWTGPKNAWATVTYVIKGRRVVMPLDVAGEQISGH